MADLNRSQRKALFHAIWGLTEYDGASTGRRIRRRDMLALEGRGLVQSIFAVKCDGFSEFSSWPERWGQAWRPTLLGLDVAVELGHFSKEQRDELSEKLNRSDRG